MKIKVMLSKLYDSHGKKGKKLRKGFCWQLEVFLITREVIYLFVSSKYSCGLIWNWLLEEKVSEQNGKLSINKWPKEEKQSFQSSAGM